MDTIKKILISALAAGGLFIGSNAVQPGTASAHDHWRHEGYHEGWRGHRGGGPVVYAHPRYYGPRYEHRVYMHPYRPYRPGPRVIIAP